MPIVSQSEFRANMAKLLDQVEADAQEVYIYRQGKEAMVVMPMSRYESWKETDYLLSNPANRSHLLSARDRMDTGDGVEVEFGTDGRPVAARNRTGAAEAAE